jgi:hypothetical protein
MLVATPLQIGYNQGPMHPKICWAFGLAGLTFSALTLRAANPDLISAPAPQLSQPAWLESQKDGGNAKNVTLHAQITAAHGSVKTVAVQESQRWPRTAGDVQSWIKQQWKFIPGYSGTVVQPISFQILNAAPSGKVPESAGAWPVADKSLFVKTPNPPVPVRAVSKVMEYQKQYRYWPGVLLLMTARQGVIVDLRVLDHKGPEELCGFTVQFVRKYYQLRPDVTGSYQFPVYYGFNTTGF